jgi:tetratricopeptide (TPR) repeat protein
MEWQKSLSMPDLQTSQVIALQAESGQSRQDCVQQWLQQAETQGATTWLLNCDRTEGGPWAGLNEWLENLLPEIRSSAPELVTRHDYEFANVLPALRKTMVVRNPTLTDAAAPGERVRNYPADRAFRILHGIIDLIASWKKQSSCHTSTIPWVIACDNYDQASMLVRQFFTELMRRAGHTLNLTLLLISEPGSTGALQAFPLSQQVRLNFPLRPSEEISPADKRCLAQALEQQVGADMIELEIHASRLIRYWLLSDRPENAVIYQIRACSIYTTRGLYKDALEYGEAALDNLKRYGYEDVNRYWNVCVKLYNCYVGLDQPDKAMQIIEMGMTKTQDSDHLFQGYYMTAMMHARYLPERDLSKAESLLEKGLAELAKTRLPQHMKVFHAAFNRNGLALIRHRQGLPQEAVKICQTCYEQLNTYLEADQHQLHRSVLLYNIAQVYAYMGSHNEAITYYTDAITLDQNYSEYYNERGNLFLKLERLPEALQDYLKAIELSPPYPEVWFNLGQCYCWMGRITEAISAYSTCLDLAPDQSSVLVARAQAYEWLEQPQAALADYDTALVLQPQQPMLLANRATLRYELEHFSLALDDLNQAISLAPKTADLYQNRAIAWIALSHFDEAIQDLKTYLSLCPEAEDRTDVEGQIVDLLVGSQPGFSAR